MLTNSKKPRYQYLRKIMLLPMAMLLTGLFAFTYHQKQEATGTKPVVVVIDAGHGGSETGVISGSVKEADLNLQLAKWVQSLNDDPAIQVILTRKEDSKMTQEERTQLSKQMRADLFISLHMNSAGSEIHKGIEVYTASKVVSENNRILASTLINSLKDIYGTTPVIKQRKEEIYVLDKSPCPSALIECGFITNPSDLAFISDPANQQKIAKGILQAIREFSLRRITETRAYNDTDKPWVRVVGKYPDPVKPTAEQLKSWQDAKTYGVWIDNKKVPNGQLNKFKATDFANHTVSKLAKNAAHYGEYVYQVDLWTNEWFSKNHKNGESPDIHMWMRASASDTSASKALVVVDGKIIGSMNDMKAINDIVNTNDLESVNVLKGEAAIKKYGDKGKEGVIEITTKKTTTNQQNKTDDIDNGPVFQKVEISPVYPGGQSSWVKYLERNINALVPDNENAPAGIYSVFIQFTIDEAGNVTDIKPLTDHGYGMENEVEARIQKSLKWSPGIQNGRPVRMKMIQPITFVLALSDNLNGTPIIKNKNEINANLPEVVVTANKTKKGTTAHGSWKGSVLTIEELKKSTPYSLCGLEPGTEIVSFVFTIDKPDNSIVEAYNKGAVFSEATKMQIAEATSGKTLTIDNIRIVYDGKEKKVAAKAYMISD